MRIEGDEQGRRRGKRLLCPQNPPNNKQSAQEGKGKKKQSRLGEENERGKQRRRFLESRGQKLPARPAATVEPFNEWFESLFELTGRVWHRGLDNNRSQLPAALFCYRRPLRYNHRCRPHNGQIRSSLEAP